MCDMNRTYEYVILIGHIHMSLSAGKEAALPAFSWVFQTQGQEKVEVRVNRKLKKVPPPHAVGKQHLHTLTSCDPLWLAHYGCWSAMEQSNWSIIEKCFTIVLVDVSIDMLQLF